MEALFINGAFELVPSWIVNAEAVVRANARPARRKRPIPPPDFLDIGNVAEHMRGGMKPPAMLVKGWLQRGALHWLQGQPEHGKSWVPLWLAKQVMKENPRARVLWMDGEMGSATLADRLLALGMDPDVIENQLVHVNLTTVPRGQFDEFITWVVRRRFQLVVWDPMAQHLAGADLSEQSNSEVAQWLAAMVNPVSAYGGTTIAVDHISKTASADDPRGAGAKKARARIIYAVARRNRFDRRTRGEIEIECVKNFGLGRRGAVSAGAPGWRSVRMARPGRRLPHRRQIVTDADGSGSAGSRVGARCRWEGWALAKKARFGGRGVREPDPKVIAATGG